MEIKTLSAEIVKASSDQYDARFILSAASPDRVRDTIDPDAYDAVAKSTDKLVALFNHDPNRPVGFWQKLAREKDTLTGYIKFAGTNLGAMLKQLIIDGVPLGASIGFRGSGEPNELGGIHFNALEIIETSITPTPAHPRAIEVAKHFGIALASIEDDSNSTESRTYDETRKRAALAFIAAKRIEKGATL